jgi:dihydrofolate reductase
VPEISLVAAMAKNRVIGKGLDIPWKIKGEQVRFRELTTGKVMVMGRLTYESIGRPLPNRTNVILTRDKSFKAEGCDVLSSFDAVLEKYADEKEIMVAGGGQLYKDTLPLATKLYLTVIDKEFDGDIFFPDFDLSAFEENAREDVEGEIPYSYFTYTRKG